MSYKKSHEKGRWIRRIIPGILAILVVVMGVDYGKHWALKRVIEKEIDQSGGLISCQSICVSFWPLLENHLVLQNFHVNVPDAPIVVTQICLRRGWRDWHLAHIKGKDVKIAESAHVQEAQGILDTRDLAKQIKASELLLQNIKIKLPLIAFSGPRASFNFLYKMDTHQLTLKGDAPELSFTNGATFGLSGDGAIQTKNPIQGKMGLKIKNIDKMMKELVAAGVVEASQADLVTMGSNFLGKIGLHDISLPLKIQDGDVSLGPVVLFKIK
ncbi:MAG: DUF2125 domain-containing protein [Candidatus Paracaedibacter sp.]